ncbi:hypothetical protein [Merismopedia glauca]|uniref:Uncharacterized protein n=1 Tax=Merismopedia glauca CCAP 1448/3 TaxID=1296344 RepID=A0A2T1C7N7_9CYAN|nr:hypothetical protein [Merismopedia glauca]PSB04271.1 hypothetical protein C7B64_04740 [Merismopedia glauca CCAP 1448/3]
MDKNDSDLIDEVLKKIGKNILIFQQIEKGLKILIPFIHPNAGAKGMDSLRKYREGVKSQTLGNLIKSFLDCVDYDPEYFAEGLKNIVANRNQLVHGLGEFKNLNLLDTQEGCRKYISYLDSQHQEAVEFYKDIKLYVGVLLYFLQENYAESNRDFNLLYERVKSILPSDVEYINLSNPSDTIWKNTKIVELLRLAEIHTVKINNMTSLNLAEQFIKNQAPECTPKKYGIKTLKGVLKASGLFEIIETKKNEKGSISILYRSKIT